jgi:hypothetical protein
MSESMHASLVRARTAFLAAVAIGAAAGCTSILGVTDVPNGPTATKDAATADADTDSGDTMSSSDAGSGDAATCVGANGQCPTDMFMGMSAPTGAGCCSSFCITNAAGGTCDPTAGTYSIKVNGKPVTNIDGILASQQPQLNLEFKLASGVLAGLSLSYSQVGTGCTFNHIEMLTTTDDFKDDGTAGCGLVVNSIAPDTIQATFSGTLTGLTSQMVDVSIKQPLK